MPSLKDLRAQIPELSGLDDDAAVAVIHQAYYPDLELSAVASALGHKAKEPKAEPSGKARRLLGDTGLSLLKGVIGVPEAALGLADLVTGGAAGRMAQAAGFRPAEAKAILDEYLSPEQQAANREVQRAEGFMGKMGAALANPSVIAQTVLESLPAMGAGGVVARGVTSAALRASPALAGRVAAAEAAPLVASPQAQIAAARLPVYAGAAGEGVVGAGMSAEQIRQETPGGELSAGQSALAAGSGALTGVLGVLGGRLSQRLGIGDIDTMLAQASRATGAQRLAAEEVKKGVTRRVLEGIVSEGVLEELPQSLQEQIAQNLATGKPIEDGLDHAAVLGLLSGGLMGGVAGGLGHSGKAAADKLRAEGLQEERGPATRALNAAVEAAAKKVDADPGLAFAASKMAAAAGLENATTSLGAAPERQKFSNEIDFTPELDTGKLAIGEPPTPVAPSARSPEQIDAAVGQMHQQAAEDLQATRVWEARKDLPRTPGEVIGQEPDALAMMQSTADAERRADQRPDPNDIREAIDETERRNAATRALYATILPTDILNPKGEPFRNERAANTVAKREGGSVVVVEGGWAVRPKETNAPATGGTAGSASPDAGRGDGTGVLRDGRPADVPAGAAPAAGEGAERPGAVALRPDGPGEPAAPALTLREQWQAAVARGDKEAARAINEQIVAEKKGNAPVQPAAPEAKPVQAPAPAAPAAPAAAAGAAAGPVEAAGVTQGGPGSDAGNGFKHGPKKGERYRVGAVAAAGGALVLEKRLPAGTSATFYVGKDGNFIDSDNVNFIGSGRENLWIPESKEAADRATAILDELGRLELTDPKRKEAKERLKALVTSAVGGSVEATGVKGKAPAASSQDVTKVASDATPKPQNQPDLVKIMTVFGTNTYVRRADIEGEPNGLIRQFTKDGKNNGRLARGNLDPTGEKRAAEAKEDAANPLFNIITRKGGATFANRTAAKRELMVRGMQDTHEVVAASDVKPGLDGFLIRKKAEDKATAPAAPSSAAPTTQGEGNGQEVQAQEALTPSQPTAEPSTATPVAESTSPRDRDSGDAGVATGQGGSGPARESAADIKRRNEYRDRLRSYWDGTATPAIRAYLRAFDAFGADRLERNRIKPEGMSAREWLESFVSRQSTWDKGRKTGQTGIQYLSIKDLWPTDDGHGEQLRKAALEAVKALKNAPGSTSELLAEAFMEPKPSAPTAPTPQPTSGEAAPAAAPATAAPAVVPGTGGAAVEADGVSPLATAKVGDTVDVVHRDSNGDLRVTGTVLSVEDAGIWIKESDGRRLINRNNFGNWIKTGTQEKKTDNYATWTAYEGASPAYVTIIGERDGEVEIDDGYTAQWVPKSQVEQASKAAADPFESEKLNLTRIKEISDRQGMNLDTDHMRSPGLAATGWSAEAAESAANAMVPPVVRELADAVQDSIEGMRKRIADVQLADTDGESNAITFAFDGVQYRGILKGRNADLAVAGDGRESDRGIAVRVILDGDATPTKAAPKEGDFIRPATNAERMMSATRRDGIAGNLGGIYLAKGSRGAGFYKRPAATATHKDPGEPSEPVTPAVVKEAITKAAKREEVSPKQMLADALRLIDEAIATAPTAAEAQADAKKKEREFDDKTRIDVPGDGTFTVVNTKERLREFRDLVQKSPGFTGKYAKPRIEKAVSSGNLSANALAREMLDEGEPLNALEVLDAAGTPMMFGRGRDGEPLVHTDVSPVEIGGDAGFFAGQHWHSDKKKRLGWAVIDTSSGMAAGTGVNRAAAVSVAQSNMKRDNGREVLEKARAEAGDGRQDELRAAFIKSAEQLQQATFFGRDRIQAQQAAFNAKERERDAFYRSIMGEDAKRPQPGPTSNGWKPEDVKPFLSAAEKAGKAGEAIDFIRDVLSQASLDGWGNRVIGEWEKANTNTFLSTQFGQPIDLKKPPHTLTWDEVEASVRANTYIPPQTQRAEGMLNQWRKAHMDAVKTALDRGWKVPDRVLYDYRGLVRNDLNDEDADLAADAMVTTYQQTKDYGKAVQAYRDWKPGVDLKGFEQSKSKGGFTLDDGDVTVLVEKTKTWDGKDRFQARLKNSTTSSGPNLTEQQAIDWSANLREDMRKAAPAQPAAPSATTGAQQEAPTKRPDIAAIHRDKTLDKQTSEDGEVMTRRQWVERKVADGLKPQVKQEDRIKPMSRVQFFRATNEEQRAHERKIKEAGKKDVYWLGDYEVTKTEHDYAASLLAESATATSAVAGPEAAPSAPQAESAAAPAVSSVAGQKNLAYRGSRIASLLAMNEQIRKLDPSEAWHPDNINDATDLDALQDSISSTLVRLQRQKAEKDAPAPDTVSALIPLGTNVATIGTLRRGDGQEVQARVIRWPSGNLGPYGLAIYNDGKKAWSAPFPGIKSTTTKQQLVDMLVDYLNTDATQASDKYTVAQQAAPSAEPSPMRLPPTETATERPSIGQQWDAMNTDQRNAVAAEAGWRTAKGGVNPQGRAISRQGWVALADIVRVRIGNVIAKQGAESAQKSAPTVEAKAPEPETVQNFGEALPPARRNMAERREQEQAEQRETAEAAKYKPFDAKELSKKPTPASMSGWFTANYEGKTVWTQGTVLDLSGEPPHMQGYADRMSPNRNKDGKLDVSRVIPRQKGPEAVPFGYYDGEYGKAAKNGVVYLEADGELVGVDARFFRYFASKFKGASYFASPNGGVLTVQQGGKTVGVIMPIKLGTDAQPAPSVAELRAKIGAPAAPAAAKPADSYPITAAGAVEAFNDDNAPQAMQIVAKLKIDALQEVGAAIGFRPQVNETAKAFRERLGGVADKLTKTAREKAARQKALYDKLIDRAMAYDRAADHMANSLRLGNPVDSQANMTGYKPMDGNDEGGWVPIPEALDKYAADVASLRNDPEYAEVASMVSSKRPRVFEHKAAPTPAAPSAEEKGAPAKPGTVENFGESLPPARRNMAAKLTEDLADEDIAKRPFSEIWPLAENEAIEDTFAAAVAHAARAEVPAKPRQPYKLRQYVEKVKTLRGLAGRIVSGEVTRERMGALIDRQFGTLRDWWTKVQLLEQLPRDQWKRVEVVEERPDSFTYEDGKQVPAPMVRIRIDDRSHWLTGDPGVEDKARGTVAGNMAGIRALLDKAEPEARMKFEIRQNSRTGEVFINKEGDAEKRRLMTFASVEEARKAITEQYDALVGAWDAVKARDNITERDLRRTDNRPRVGKDHRGGKDITIEEFQDRFGFRGGEFGAWVKQGKGDKERQALLNGTYDALMDLAELLNLPPRAMSLNGTLGIALGSRGSGWASAHFEPSNLVINLTKTRGAGTLAHEWFHALDNYFSRLRRDGAEAPFTGDQKKYREENYITHRPEALMVRKDRARGFQPLTQSQLELRRERHKSGTRTGWPAPDAYDADKWERDPSTPELVRPEVEARFVALVQALKDSPMAKRAALLDKGGGYWSRTLELAARAFENYVIARMHEQGYHNDFLVNVKKPEEVAKTDARYPYLLAGEVKPIADAFDGLFGEIKTRDTEGGNVAMFSRSTTTGPRIDLASAQALAEKLAADGLLKLNVVQSSADLPPRLLAQLSKSAPDGRVRGVYFRSTDQVWLVADHIRGADEFVEVALHEAFHRGLGRLIPGVQPVLNEIWRTNQSVRKATAEQMRTHGIGREEAIEEALAKMAEAGTVRDLKGWPKLLEAIRSWLGKIARAVGIEMTWTDDMVADLVAAATREGLRGGVHVSEAEADDLVAAKRAPSVTVDTDEATGAPVYATDDITIGFPQETERFEYVLNPGEKLVNYSIGPADGFDSYGFVELVIGADGVPKALADIEIKPELRGQAIGEKVMEALLGAHPGVDIEISNIVEGARGFWSKMGVPEQNRAAGEAYDGTLNYETFRQAQDDRGANRAAAGRGEAGQGRDATAEGGARGAGKEAQGLMLSRADPADMRAAPVLQQIQQRANDLLTTQRTFNWWHRTVGTQFHKAKVDSDFGRVFNAAQDYLHDTSAFANDPADLAPDLLPQLKHLGDLKKSLTLKKDDREKLAAAVFEGTLNFTRDDSGTAVEAGPDDTPGVVWTPTELRERFGFNDQQVKLYEQTRAAIDRSLDTLVASDVARLFGDAMPAPVRALVSGGDLGRFRGIVTALTTQKLEAAQAELADVRKRQRTEMSAFWKKQKAALEGPQGRAGTRHATITDLEQEKAELQSKHARDLADAEAEAAKWADLQRTVAGKYQRIGELKARGYAPLQRFGRYTLDVVGEDGTRKFFGLYESEAEANAAARAFREAAEPGDKVSQGVLSEEAYKQFSGMTPETLELFAEVAGVEKNEVFQEYLRRAKNNRSALKRLIHRKGVAGYSEDTSRVLAQFIVSNARAASTNLHVGEIGKAIQDIPKEKGDVIDEAIRLREYVQTPQEEAQAIRALLFTQYLGGSVASAMVNLTQPLMMTLPYLSQFGGVAAAVRHLTGAVKAALGSYDRGSELGKALALAEKEGIVSPQELHQLQAEASGTLARNPGLRRALFAWGSLFSAAEQFNRRLSFIAAFNSAKERGMDDPAGFAARAVEETQGIYNKGNKPRWARGAVGGTLFTFKQYSVSYMEFLKRLPTRERTLALAVLLLAAGAQGMPGADDLDDIIDTIGQGLGYDTNAKLWKTRVLSDAIGDDGADFVLRGFSALPGFPLDVAGRLGLGNLIPGTGLLLKSKTDKAGEVAEALGPVASTATGAAKAIQAAAGGNVSGVIDGIAPKGIKDLAKALEMYQTGEYRDSKGRKVTAADTTDALVKSLGFQPAPVARDSRRVQMAQQQIALARVTETEIADAIARARVDGKPEDEQAARQRLARWNEVNPESRIVVTPMQIIQRVRQLRTTRDERFVRAAPREMRQAVTGIVQ